MIWTGQTGFCSPVKKEIPTATDVTAIGCRFGDMRFVVRARQRPKTTVRLGQRRGGVP